jgi:hypothetical protein
MNQDVQQIPVSFNKDGFHYSQICRSETAAIYKQSAIAGTSVYYEVWVIRVVPSRILFGITYPVMEKGPRPEDWGTRGWTFYDLDSAQRRYDLVNSRVEHPYSSIAPKKV